MPKKKMQDLKHGVIHCKVVHGQGIGKKIGFPTINLELIGENFLPTGVFVCEIVVGNKTFDGLAAVGHTELIGEPRETVEVHVFDFCQDIYSQEVKIKLLKKLREMKKFDSIRELRKQIEGDIKEAKGFLSR